MIRRVDLTLKRDLLKQQEQLVQEPEWLEVDSNHKFRIPNEIYV